MVNNSVLAGLGIGAALAFVFDPDRGARRRALARDQIVRASRKTRDGLDATIRDVANRSRGVAASVRGRFRHEETDDQRLAARVRSVLGRYSSHPRAIEVDVMEGEVGLRGPILAGEAAAVIAAVEGVRGVRGVRNLLETHNSTEGIPALQGGARRPGARLDVLQDNWAPATQTLVAAAGIMIGSALMTLYSRR
jgi:osmotically-inducible protein OsmY